jgi:hypothetical protein
MPSYTRNKKRDNLVYVPINSVLYYGFNTKDLAAISGISSTDLTTTLGHIDAATAAAATGKILILGANAPKPPRVTRKLAAAAAGTQQTISTFCSKAKLSLALADKWNVSHRGKSATLRPANASSGSQSAVAVLSDGTRYAFPMNKEDFTTYGSALGLQAPSQVTGDERDKVVSGTSKPRPGRAKIKVESGGTFQSFFSSDSSDSAVTAGFEIVEEELILTPVTTTP